MAFILLADDDGTLVSLLREYLESKGNEVVVAQDGEALVELAKKRRPDLMIVDVHMPGQTGVEAFKSLPDLLTREIPAIFISGLPPADARQKTFLPPWARGLLLHKPLELPKLDAAIAQLLGKGQR